MISTEIAHLYSLTAPRDLCEAYGGLNFVLL